MEGGQLDRHHLGKLMWDVLQKHGIDHRKLGRRTKLLILSKVSKTWGFCGILTKDGRHGTFEDGLQRRIFRGRRRTKDMYRQINVGCSREGLHTSIGNPFFVFCCPCCIRCWVVSVDCRKGTGDHVSWKHMRCYKGRLFESPDFVRQSWWVTVCFPTALRCHSIGNSLHANGASALRSCCRSACVCLFWPHDDVSAAAVIHCTRSRCSIRNSLHAEEGSTPKSCNLQIPLTLNPLILSCP